MQERVVSMHLFSRSISSGRLVQYVFDAPAGVTQVGFPPFPPTVLALNL